MVEILDANRAAPTKGHDSDRPARKKTLPVILTRRTDNRPMVNMPHMYAKIIATSRAGIVRVGCMVAHLKDPVRALDTAALSNLGSHIAATGPPECLRMAFCGVWMGQCDGELYHSGILNVKDFGIRKIHARPFESVFRRELSRVSDVSPRVWLDRRWRVFYNSIRLMAGPIQASL